MKFNLKNQVFCFALLLSFLFLLPAKAVPGTTVSLPITIDYQLLRSLVIYTAFTDSDQTATVLNVNNGCRKITISNPRFTMKNSHIQFETKVHVHAGTYQKNKCTKPVKWEGYLLLIQDPKIEDKEWTLSFDTIDYVLLDGEHKPAKVTGIVRELIETWVYDYLNHITINLAPPVSELKSLISELFPPDLRFLAEKMLYSMRTGKVFSDPDALRIFILAETEDIFAKVRDVEKEAISEEEIKEITKTWEAWDSFLVYIFNSLIKKPLSDDDRQVLLDTLLETRHSFISELSNGTLERDFVRQQFITAWEELSPVFRNHLCDEPSKDLMSYLAFFTISDTLIALDKVSLDLGIEINRNSLIRMARLLSKGKPVTLDYNTNVNEELGKILGLEPPESKPDSDKLETNDKKPLSMRDYKRRLPYNMRPSQNVQFCSSSGTLCKDLNMRPLLCSKAWAEENDPTIMNDNINDWVFYREDLDSYLERIKALLTDASDSTLKKSKMPDHYYDLYRLIVLASAWQESCFRQFRIKKGNVAYLRSYNGTSVGLMQINERVWRGIYNYDHLRWDIHYNAMVGCEIIDLYFCRYALRKMKRLNLEKPLEDDTLARIIYAMYNGGPGQFKKYLKRSKREKHYLSDRLFWDKYVWVKSGQWHNIRKCLIGG